MAVYKITPPTSILTTAASDHAFDLDSAAVDSLTIDADAFVVAMGGSAFGAFLVQTGA